MRDCQFCKQKAAGFIYNDTNLCFHTECLGIMTDLAKGRKTKITYTITTNNTEWFLTSKNIGTVSGFANKDACLKTIAHDHPDAFIIVDTGKSVTYVTTVD